METKARYFGVRKLKALERHEPLFHSTRDRIRPTVAIGGYLPDTSNKADERSWILENSHSLAEAIRIGRLWHQRDPIYLDHIHRGFGVERIYVDGLALL